MWNNKKTQKNVFPYVNFCLTSGEVFNHYINWSKASFDFSIADIDEQNNVLHICWLFCNITGKHLGWHAKEETYVK